MRPSLTFMLVSLVAGSATLGAQQAAHTISPGMTRAQVVTALGKPVTLREADGWTYIFYRNQCTRACGMNDLVVLHADSVVDAIFRSPDRHYTGTSSSPAPIPARVARRGNPSSSVPLKVKSTTKVNPKMKPGPPNDAHPSIPVNPPKLAPAPAPAQKKPSATAPGKP